MALVFAGGATAWIWLEEIPSQFGIKILYPWDVGLIVLITILGALYFWVKMPSEFRLIALVTVVMGIGVILQRLAYAGVVVYTKNGTCYLRSGGGHDHCDISRMEYLYRT